MDLRNITLFRFSPLVAMDLSVRLPIVQAQHQLRDIGPLEMSTTGFTPPALIDVEFIGVKVGTQSKVLPTASINHRLARKVALIAEQEDRKVTGRERKRLREDIITEMLPGAPVREVRVPSYVDTRDGWLVVGTASRKGAESVVMQYREAMGSFPAVPLAPEEGPRVLLTDWLANHTLPAGLKLGDECELRDPATATGAIVRCRRQDLDAEEVKEHLRNGKQVYRLGLVFDNRISFVLGEDLSIRKFKLLDVVLDELDEADTGSLFALTTRELRRLLNKMQEWFGLPRPGDAA